MAKVRYYCINVLWFLTVGFTLCFAACHNEKQKKITIACSTIVVTTPPPDAQQHIVTVWVHGTRVFFAQYFMHDFFYVPPGLVCATAVEPRYHIREIAELLQEVAPYHFCNKDFYVYGWSGKLSFKARYKAAKKLYQLLHNLTHEYEKSYGKQPYLRVITHSHGGNVALNMAHYNQDSSLVIDELIMLACPVQRKTDLLTHNPMFKKIYSLYSKYDSLQVLDPQKIYYWLNYDYPEMQPGTEASPLFSERCFSPAPHIYQMQIMLNNAHLMHIEFLTNTFIKVLPQIVETAHQLNDHFVLLNLISQQN